jgi:hypothetical protein
VSWRHKHAVINLSHCGRIAADTSTRRAERGFNFNAISGMRVIGEFITIKKAKFLNTSWQNSILDIKRRHQLATLLLKVMNKFVLTPRLIFHLKE